MLADIRSAYCAHQEYGPCSGQGCHGSEFGAPPWARPMSRLSTWCRRTPHSSTSSLGWPLAKRAFNISTSKSSGSGGGSGGGGSNVTISDTPPTGAIEGDLWWNEIDGRLYIYYDDGNTAQWVDTNPSGGGSGLAVVTISDTPPDPPTQGQLWWNNIDGRLYVYYNDGNTAQWVDTSPNGGSEGGGVPVVISDTAPGGATPGQLWWNTIDGRLFVYYDDGTTAQWVDASPAGGGDGGVPVTVSPTAPGGATEGQLWWNTVDGRLFVFYDDGTTAQWVDASPSGAQGPEGPPGAGFTIYANFDGTGVNGPAPIRASLGVASITKTSTGRYSVVFDTPQANANYIFISGASASTGVLNIANPTTTGFDLFSGTNSNGAVNLEYNYFSIIPV